MTLEHILGKIETLQEVGDSRAILDAMESVIGFDEVIKHWISASKMRPWFNGLK